MLLAQEVLLIYLENAHQANVEAESMGKDTWGASDVHSDCQSLTFAGHTLMMQTEK